VSSKWSRMAEGGDELTEAGGSLAVVTLPEQEDSTAGAASRAASVRWAGPATIPGGSGPEPIEQWLAACRVERFLEGFGMARGRRRELIVQNCLARAVGRWREVPDADLSALALEQIEDALGRWFAFVLGEESLGDQSPLLLGRGALEACAAARRWPDALLTYDHLPPAFVDAMRAAKLAPTPAEMPGSMLAQPLEFWSPRELLMRVLARWSGALPGPAAPAA
jgi:hypothetical protein